MNFDLEFLHNNAFWKERSEHGFKALEGSERVELPGAFIDRIVEF